ncbi:MAG: FkbM family methyltransferase [Planctomycetota bacterium]
MMEQLALVSLATALVALAANAWLWKKLHGHSLRQRRQTLAVTALRGQIATISRAALHAEVRVRCGERGAAAVSHAQHGEEYFLWGRCGFKPKGVFIEIGAYDGSTLSNSLFFEQIGWRGMLVEAHPDLAAQCRRSRPEALVVHAALGTRDGGETTFSMVRGTSGHDTLSFVSADGRHLRRITAQGGTIEAVTVPARTLRGLVAQHGLEDVDWISIDVEGAELEVLKGAGLGTFKPGLLLIEDNSRGASSAVRDYVGQFGYTRVMRIGCNDLYERGA